MSLVFDWLIKGTLCKLRKVQPKHLCLCPPVHLMKWALKPFCGFRSAEYCIYLFVHELWLKALWTPGLLLLLSLVELEVLHQLDNRHTYFLSFFTPHMHLCSCCPLFIYLLCCSAMEKRRGSCWMITIYCIIISGLWDTGAVECCMCRNILVYGSIYPGNWKPELGMTSPELTSFQYTSQVTITKCSSQVSNC